MYLTFSTVLHFISVHYFHNLRLSLIVPYNKSFSQFQMRIITRIIFQVSLKFDNRLMFCNNYYAPSSKGKLSKYRVLVGIILVPVIVVVATIAGLAIADSAICLVSCRFSPFWHFKWAQIVLLFRFCLSRKTVIQFFFYLKSEFALSIRFHIHNPRKVIMTSNYCSLFLNKLSICQYNCT